MKTTTDDKRDEVEAVAPGHLPEREFLMEVDVLCAEALGVELDHDQERRSSRGRSGSVAIQITSR